MLRTLLRNLMRKAVATRGITSGRKLAAIGVDSFNRGDFAAASRDLSAAHEADPADGGVLYYLALAEARGGRLERAQVLFEELLVQRDDADVNNAIGNVHRLRGDLDAAAASYQRAVERDGGHLAALANLGLTLRDRGAPRDALPVLDRALAIAPDHIEALFNKALTLVDLGEAEEGGKLVERVLMLDPEFAQAHLQRGFMLLRRAEFAAGWREYAWRVRIPELDHWRDYDYPLWQGESLSGRRILIQAEQGLGDQIMFASCIPDLLARAQHTIIECDARLTGLFARSFPSAAIYRHRVKGKPEWLREPAPDFRARCGDLPRMLRNSYAKFPHHAGYLAADPALAAHWRARLEALGPGLKVGISWRGGTPGTGQAARSLALAVLCPVLSIPAAHFVSLQYGAVRDEVADLQLRHGIAVHEWPEAIADMDEIAALIAGLDLVVTVCTTVAHLCGALGKAAWVMVPALAEWRYLESGSRIPWYPALRLIRQSRLNQWDEVVAIVRSDLRALASADGAGCQGVQNA